MPVERIVHDPVPIGTILREGKVVHVVDSVTEIDDFDVGWGRAPSWNKKIRYKLTFRPPTSAELEAFEVMES